VDFKRAASAKEKHKPNASMPFFDYPIEMYNSVIINSKALPNMKLKKRKNSRTGGRRKCIKLDKEALYDNAIQLKITINSLQRENELLKSKYIQSKEECGRNNKLLQELAYSSDKTIIQKNCKDMSFIVSLKKKISELNVLLVELKVENEKLKKDIKLTKQNETEMMILMLEKECRRLRLMLEVIIRDKNSFKSINLSTKLIEEKATIKELKEANIKLKSEIEQLKIIQEQALAKLKKHKTKKLNRKEELTQSIQSLEHMNEVIDKLKKENKELKDEILLLKNKKTEVKVEKVVKNYEELRETINRLTHTNEQLNERINQYTSKINELSKEIREIKVAAREKEEVYILKALEEKEKMTQRIVRLQLELEAKSKELIENELKSKVLNEITKSFVGFKEVSRPLVEYEQLIPAIHQFKVTLINTKQTLNELKNKLFEDYKADERISIKEVIKIFQRRPLYLPLAIAEDLARYLIEVRNNPEVAYNKYNEILIADLRIKLDNFLAIDFTDLNFQAIKRSAVSKVKREIDEVMRAVYAVVEEKGELDSIAWLKICKEHCTELSSIECDCIMALMVNENNNVKTLEHSVCLLVYNNRS